MKVTAGGKGSARTGVRLGSEVISVSSRRGGGMEVEAYRKQHRMRERYKALGRMMIPGSTHRRGRAQWERLNANRGQVLVRDPDKETPKSPFNSVRTGNVRTGNEQDKLTFVRRDLPRLAAAGVVLYALHFTPLGDGMPVSLLGGNGSAEQPGEADSTTTTTVVPGGEAPGVVDFGTDATAPAAPPTETTAPTVAIGGPTTVPQG